MSSSKKIDLERDFAAGVFICLRPRIPYSPTPHPLHTVYVYTVYLFTQGMGKGRLNQRED